MRRELYQYRTNGTITIYLSLILLIILSLICTIIEGARVSTAKVIAERALTTSMDSVLAEYYRPLWDEYHMFAYNAGPGSSEERSVGIEEKLAEYMSYTLEPDQNLEGGAYQNALELYDISLKGIAADNQTKLMDYKGELYINEAVEYMKYDEVADGLELLLDKFSLLETPKKVSAIYDEKLAAEAELVEIDKAVLELMELLDGIDTSKKGIELDHEGKLQIKQYFVKQFCNVPVTSKVVNINNDTVFLAVKDHYINPIDKTNKMKSILGSITQREQELGRLREAQRANSEELYRAAERLRELDSTKKKSKKIIQQIKDASAHFDSIMAAGRRITLSIEEQNKVIERNKADEKAAIGEFLNTVSEMISLAEEAISTIDEITGIAGRAGGVISKFEKALDTERGDLNQEVFEELKEELKGMKRYTSSGNENGYAAMKESLEFDLGLLKNSKGYLTNGITNLEQGNYQAADSALSDCSNELKEYKIGNLKLDYSSLVLDQSKKKNPVSKLNSLLQQGLASLVIDPQKISKKELSADQLPSVEEAMFHDTTNFMGMLSDFMKSSMAGGEDSAIQDLFRGYNNTSDIYAILGEGVNNEKWQAPSLMLNRITEQLLFREYLKKHFELYEKKSESAVVKKPSALDYEQEYLLIGKMSDRDNLASVIARIVFLRTIADFVSILSDKAKCEEALVAATALVGFTGLPFLISITKTALLIAWSFAEALVDTCALMKGMEVPFIKKNMVVTFPELFQINRTYLEKKTAAIEKAKLSFSYQDYLRIFLLLKNKKDLAYRSMDLIQENINLRYQEKFLMTNCLYGFATEAKFSISTKFLAIPFIRKNITTDISGFGFRTSWESSY